jgi:hypothetical protein
MEGLEPYAQRTAASTSGTDRRLTPAT